jgi:hypothetical protein
MVPEVADRVPQPLSKVITAQTERAAKGKDRKRNSQTLEWWIALCTDADCGETSAGQLLKESSSADATPPAAHPQTSKQQKPRNRPHFAKSVQGNTDYCAARVAVVAAAQASAD